MATGYIRGLLPQRSKKKTFRAGRVTTIDERSRAKQGSRRYEGDYQRGGGGDYDSRLADGFRMLGDDDGLQ